MLAPVIKENYTESVYTLDDARKIIHAEIRERKGKKTKIIIQKTMGVICLILTVIIPLICDGDATACIVTAPLGIGLLCAKEIIIY